MRTSQWMAASVFCFLLAAIIWIANHGKSSSVSPKSPLSSATSLTPAIENSGSSSEGNVEVNPLTDHDTNHDWLVSSTAKLVSSYQRLPPGRIKDSVAELLSDENTLEETNEQKYGAFAAMSPQELEPWAIDSLKFGSVTAERFAAVSISTTAYLFEDSYRTAPNDNPIQNILGRAKEVSELIQASYLVLDPVDAHPSMAMACKEDASELKGILGRAKPLLLKSVQLASEAPTPGYVLLANSEMLANEVSARNSCFRGWDMNKRN